MTDRRKCIPGKFRQYLELQKELDDLLLQEKAHKLKLGSVHAVRYDHLKNTASLESPTVRWMDHSFEIEKRISEARAKLAQLDDELQKESGKADYPVLWMAYAENLSCREISVLFNMNKRKVQRILDKYN